MPSFRDFKEENYLEENSGYESRSLEKHKFVPIEEVPDQEDDQWKTYGEEKEELEIEEENQNKREQVSENDSGNVIYAYGHRLDLDNPEDTAFFEAKQKEEKISKIKQDVKQISESEKWEENLESKNSNGSMSPDFSGKDYYKTRKYRRDNSGEDKSNDQRKTWKNLPDDHTRKMNRGFLANLKQIFRFGTEQEKSKFLSQDYADEAQNVLDTVPEVKEKDIEKYKQDAA